MPSDTTQLLFEGSPTPILLLSSEGTVERLNRAARRVLAVQPERILGRPILARVLPQDRDRVRRQFMKVLAGQNCEWTTRFKRGDSVVRVQRVNAAPIHTDGVARGIVMFIRDLTEGREGRPETLQLQTLLENLPGQFVAVLDSKGRLRYTSGLSRLHFRDDVESVGLLYDELLDLEKTDPVILDELHEAVADGQEWSGVHWHRRMDGLSFPVQTFVVPHLDPSQGRVLGSLIVGQDKSEEHRLQERAGSARNQAQVGELVADVAKEFEASLGRLAALAEDGAQFRRELNHMSALAQGIGELGQYEKLNEERFLLRDIVVEVTSEIASPDIRGAIHVVTDLQEGDGSLIADRGQISRVFELLLANAIDNVGERDGRKIRVRIRDSDDQLFAEISDSGPGVQPEELHRLFEPLFTTRSGRAGLGLSIAKMLVEANGGRLWVELDEDSTLVFSVSLPVPGTTSPARFRPTPLALGQDRSILVVDDEESIRHSLRRFLSRVGFDVREAWSGRSAIAQITAGRPPELVLTDLRMTDGSGSWFLNQLLRDFPELLNRTVIITGDPDREDVQEIVDQTGCPVVAKPFDFPDLLEVLDSVSVGVR